MCRGLRGCWFEFALRAISVHPMWREYVRSFADILGLCPSTLNSPSRVDVNRWNIPACLEQEVLARDASCVYCRTDFLVPTPTRGAKASWEHIVNDEKIVTLQNITRCCMSCNSSKGATDLRTWLASNYCRRKGISKFTVAQVEQEALSISEVQVSDQ